LALMDLIFHTAALKSGSPRLIFERPPLPPLAQQDTSLYLSSVPINTVILLLRGSKIEPSPPRPFFENIYIKFTLGFGEYEIGNIPLSRAHSYISCS
jgi:hypothetical protein